MCILLRNVGLKVGGRGKKEILKPGERIYNKCHADVNRQVGDTWHQAAVNNQGCRPEQTPVSSGVENYYLATLNVCGVPQLMAAPTKWISKHIHPSTSHLATTSHPRQPAIMTLLPTARATLRARPVTRLFRQPTPAPILTPRRLYSTSDEASSMTPAESSIAATLSSNESLNPTTSVLVRDISGGCGSMYAIDIASSRFRGLNLLAQQRLVNRALGDQVKQWHGVQIRTSVPPEE